MDSTDHPAPDFCPLLTWGEPVPLLWRRVAAGRWLAWPPKQFETHAPGGSILWKPGGDFPGFYDPDPELTPVPPGTTPEIGFGRDAPVIGWGEALPCRWTRRDDGRASVQLGTMRVSLPTGQLHFDFVDRVPSPHFMPCFADRVALVDGVIGHAENMVRGLRMAPPVEGKSWRRRGPGSRWILGELSVEPAGTRFVDAPDLLPLTLPSLNEIEAEEIARLSAEERARGDVLYIRLVEDLARSEELMSRIGDDDFSAQVQRFMADNDLMRIDNGARVVFTSDRNHGVILAMLRRYGEPYTMYNENWAEPDPRAQAVVERLFAEAGYSPCRYDLQ